MHEREKRSHDVPLQQQCRCNVLTLTIWSSPPFSRSHRQPAPPPPPPPQQHQLTLAGSNKTKTFPRGAALPLSTSALSLPLVSSFAPPRPPLLSSPLPLPSRGRVHPVNTATVTTTTTTVAAASGFRAPNDAGYRSGTDGCRGRHGAPSRAAAVLRQQEGETRKEKKKRKRSTGGGAHQQGERRAGGGGGLTKSDVPM